MNHSSKPAGPLSSSRSKVGFQHSTKIIQIYPQAFEAHRMSDGGGGGQGVWEDIIGPGKQLTNTATHSVKYPTRPQKTIQKRAQNHASLLTVTHL